MTSTHGLADCVPHVPEQCPPQGPLIATRLSPLAMVLLVVANRVLANIQLDRSIGRLSFFGWFKGGGGGGVRQQLTPPASSQSAHSLRRSGRSFCCPQSQNTRAMYRRWCRGPAALKNTRKLPANESGPKWDMVSTIMALAPLPLRGFMMAVGRASTKSVFSPAVRTHHPIPPTRRSMAPEARKTAMPTNMPTRYGMIRTEVSNPVFAPSMKASYTFTFSMLRPQS
jgi:hypothetical protein